MINLFVYGHLLDLSRQNDFSVRGQMRMRLNVDDPAIHFGGPGMVHGQLHRITPARLAYLRHKELPQFGLVKLKELFNRKPIYSFQYRLPNWNELEPVPSGVWQPKVSRQ